MENVLIEIGQECENVAKRANQMGDMGLPYLCMILEEYALIKGISIIDLYAIMSGLAEEITATLGAYGKEEM